MSSKFLPALRGLFTSPEQGMEGKSLTIGHPTTTLYGHQSVTNVGTVFPGYSGGGSRADTWNVDTAVAQGYERVVWVYRCVELMSGDTSRLPFRVGRFRGTDEQEVLDEHPLYRVLNRRANPHETARAFRKRLAANVLLSKKGAFVEVTKSRGGAINRLDLLNPTRVKPIESESGDYIDYFEYTRKDGRVVELSPKKVKWIREPHPTDPFSGTTPLEAAGLSVEMDFLSRLYNVSFINNDSRPGGVLGVDADGLQQDQLDRITAQFQPGVHHAGKITVLGTGPGGISYVDTTSKPRDLQYSEMAQNAKTEVLAAFGIGESVLGNAAGRTFDNAQQELYNYWTGPLFPFMDLLSSAFDDDVEDEWECFHDTSSVAVLELPLRQKRAEALNEVQQGLRSIDEYRPLAGLTPFGNAQTRALWVSPSKAPIPANEEDARELGEAGGEEGMEGEAPAVEEGMTAQEAVEAARAEGSPGGTAAGAVEAARAAGADGQQSTAAAEAVAAASVTDEDLTIPEEAAEAVEAARMEGKSAQDRFTIEEPTDDEYTRVSLAVSAALEAAFARQQGIILARLESPKTRQGTPFWTPTGPGDTRAGADPLDADKVVAADRLRDETVATVSPIVSSAATEAGVAVLGAMATAGMFGAAGYTTAELAQVAGYAAGAATGSVVGVIAEAVDEVLFGARDVIVVESPGAAAISDVQQAVRDFYAETTRDLAGALGDMAAFAVINGARDAAADAAVPTPGGDLDSTAVIEREWVSRQDERVRPEHATAHGRVLPVGTPFDMGGGSVRYPRDPAALPHLTFGCRCRLRYFVTHRPGASLVLPDAA